MSARAWHRSVHKGDQVVGSIQENEVKESLMSTVQETLRQRKWGAAVRLEIHDSVDDGFLTQLLNAGALDLEERDVYRTRGPIDLTVLAALGRIEGFRELKEPGPERIFHLADAFRAGMRVEDVHALSFVDPWFLDQIEELVEAENALAQRGLDGLDARRLRALKRTYDPDHVFDQNFPIDPRG